MPTTDYQVWVAQEMGQLVGMAPHAQPVGKENIQKILRRCVDLFSEGNMRAASEIAGCRRSSFNNWCNGATSARIDLLLRTCYELRIPLTSLVTGTTGESEDTAGVNAAIEMRRRRCVHPCRTTYQIRAALLLAAKEQQPPSIREVAQRLGYSTPTRLYVAASDLCKTIVRNFNKSGRNHHWWRRRGAKSLDDSVIRKALEDSLSLDMPLPVQRVALSLGYGTEDPLTARFPDLCRAIKAKRANVVVARRSTLASALELALSEDPPPALEKVARRLGYTLHMAIREIEPDLCAKLTARRREFAAWSRMALGRRLETMLNEIPPPSLREVHSRLGITQAISYENFCEIHRAIVARHREFRRQARLHNMGLTAPVRRNLSGNKA